MIHHYVFENDVNAIIGYNSMCEKNEETDLQKKTGRKKKIIKNNEGEKEKRKRANKKKKKKGCVECHSLEIKKKIIEKKLPMITPHPTPTPKKKKKKKKKKII